jgi:hypothetical protein
MPTDHFYVLIDQGQWCIRYCDRKIGPFPSRQDSINAAIEAARSSGCLGNETEVLIQTEDGSFRTAWTYGDEA